MIGTTYQMRSIRHGHLILHSGNGHPTSYCWHQKTWEAPDNILEASDDRHQTSDGGHLISHNDQQTSDKGHQTSHHWTTDIKKVTPDITWEAPDITWWAPITKVLLSLAINVCCASIFAHGLYLLWLICCLPRNTDTSALYQTEGVHHPPDATGFCELGRMLWTRWIKDFKVQTKLYGFMFLQLSIGCWLHNYHG